MLTLLRMHSERTTTGNRLDTALDALLGVTGITVLCVWLRGSLRALTFPFPLDYGEGPLLDQAVRLLAGSPLYPPPASDYPFVLSNYPPVFPTLLAGLGWLRPISFASARLLILVAACACVLLVAALAHTKSHDWRGALAAGLLFVASPYFFGWSAFVRTDFVALAAGLGALLLAARRADARTTPAACAALALVAGFTRQSYLLATPIAIAAGLFIRHPRRAVGFIVTYLAAGVAGVVCLQVETSGAFLFHVVIGNANHWSGSQLLRLAGTLVGPGGPALALAAAVASKASRRDPVGVMLVVYLVGGLCSAATAGKIGSSLNYFLEAVAGISILAGCGLARAFTPHPRVRRLLAAGVVAQATMLIVFSLDDAGMIDARIAQRSEYEELARTLARERAPVLADECMGLLVLEGRRVLFQPFEFTQLALEHRWDEGRLVADLRAGRFGLILMREGDAVVTRQRWTPGMLQAIDGNYLVRGHLAQNALLRPRVREP